MARLNFMLLAVLVLCALGLVTSQHKARKLYAQFEQEQERARALDVEYGQLQLEQSTWAMHGRVEKLAGRALQMSAPDPRHTQVVELNAPGNGLGNATAEVVAMPERTPAGGFAQTNAGSGSGRLAAAAPQRGPAPRGVR
jgi:cell division protein FtsL